MQFNGLINAKPKSLLYSFLAASLVLASTFIAPSVSDAATINCSTASCLTSALSNAVPGDIIVLDATKTFTGNFTISKNGTSSAPIVIQSSSTTSKPILDGGTTSTGFTLYITGDYVQVKNLKVTRGKNGIMIDNANFGLLDGVEVYNAGYSGVHWRDGSSNNTLQNSYIHDVGVVTPDFGEGVYVGSDYLKWTENGGTYKKEVDNNIIRNNTIGPGVAAESIDIKEGSTGTIVEGNTFNGTGISGANAADSFIDAKGNNAIVRNNIGYRNGNSFINDAFQTNEKSPGWGYNNDFYNNTVNMDNTTGYVVNVKAGSAKACNNTRTPSGNMYLGAVTTYTSCGGSSDTTAPSAPTNLSATAASSSQINLSWTASTDNVGVSSYDVYRGGSFLKNVTGTSTSDTGLTASTTYSYTVKAKDAAGNVSAASNTASATTQAGAADAKFSIPGTSVTASTSDANVPANAVDGNLATRWSGNGDGAWIRFDLGSSKTVAFVKVAFYNGSTRTSTFDIQTSTDGTTWTTQQTGLTNAANNNLQTFDITDSTARYVRLIGHGNNVNTWNSYTEVEVWGR